MKVVKLFTILFLALASTLTLSVAKKLQPYEETIASAICESMANDKLRFGDLKADDIKKYHNTCMFIYELTGLDVDEEVVRGMIFYNLSDCFIAKKIMHNYIAYPL